MAQDHNVQPARYLAERALLRAGTSFAELRARRAAEQALEKMGRENPMETRIRLAREGRLGEL